MPSATTLEAPVLVVGAGPAGLAAAAELTRHGIPTLLVERRTRLSSHPRATVLSLRSMEVMRAWGLEAEVRERSVEVDWRMLQSETLADAADGTALPVGYPSPEESRMISPTAPACVAQDDVEPLLLDHLRAAPRARVELAAELTGLLAGADGIRASVRDVRTGAPRTVHARYLVAADGARSAVRGALGIRLIGPESLMEGFTTLFRAPLWELLGERRHILYSVTHSATPGTFLPTAPADRWLFGLSGSADDVPDARQAAKLIRLGAGAPDLPVRIERSKHFSATAQLAEQWRSGRTSSWPATPRIASRRGAGPASTWRCTTATTSAGGSAGCCAAGPARGCWTGTKPSAGRSPSTPPRGRRTPPAPSARPSRRCAPTSAAGSPTSGPENARRSTCSSGA